MSQTWASSMNTVQRLTAARAADEPAASDREDRWWLFVGECETAFAGGG
ncbi:MAG: hypothetical protein GY720_01570 [bacterium]|nr:hypothetical protein [bacterium]